MDEVGVSMRHAHTQPGESYLFQKIGFAKDHYETDETAFNWYAKGTPLCMDYGTYTPDVAVPAAHNLIDIPDMDGLRRGYLARHMFTDTVDYTHCEVPVTLKLLWGRVRSFDEVDGKDGVIDRTRTPYFYIGDRNPVGPKVWVVRLLLFVKPDYIALFDRVYGDVPHRYCLHTVADEVRRDGAFLHARGRFDLDLLGYVQHPADFEAETGEWIPNLPPDDGRDAARPHRQSWFRVLNRRDGIYRTLLFARERDRDVTITAAGDAGIRVTTSAYTDYVFLHNDPVTVELPDGVGFDGRVAWIRRTAKGEIQACVPDGSGIAAFGARIEGRGPWTYRLDGRAGTELKGGPPRPVLVNGIPA
jgi:hypothetical protein